MVRDKNGKTWLQASIPYLSYWFITLTYVWLQKSKYWEGPGAESGVVSGYLAAAFGTGVVAMIKDVYKVSTASGVRLTLTRESGAVTTRSMPMMRSSCLASAVVHVRNNSSYLRVTLLMVLSSVIVRAVAGLFHHLRTINASAAEFDKVYREGLSILEGLRWSQGLSRPSGVSRTRLQPCISGPEY